VISSYCTVLLKEIDEDNPWHLDISEIQKAGHRGAVLTRQLLAFSRKQILQPKVMNLGQVVAGMENVLGRLISERIELDIQLDPDLKKIRADAGQIEQVVLNLMVNARDAIAQTGSITLSVRNVVVDDQMAARHGNLPSGDCVVLVVSDDGMGMDEETRSHIFEPFFTTKGVGKGTGLGLSTVFGIVEQSRGGVEVVSEAGEGAEFRIYFPCVNASELNAEEEDSQPAPVEGSETLLIVEDEEVILNLLGRTQGKLGYTVLLARDGEEAFLVAEQHEGPIDMMITDIIMPKLDGYELAERLAPLYPEMSVLFTSGYSEVMVSAQARGHLPEQFMHKPFDAEDLAQRVRAILDARSSA
jgi:CheY-like chemotaxis protein